MRKVIPVLAGVLVLGLLPLATATARAAQSPVQFTKAPVEQSVYAMGAPLRLVVQAVSTTGGYLTYQWKWSTSAGKGDAQPVDGRDDSDAKSVLEATSP
ncbi:MAG: hypothetical protein LBR32_10165, partial [Propionibacteriaceae bacterium]|nr:hypothetical protein [Propionibacteriaceae bacterium]